MQKAKELIQEMQNTFERSEIKPDVEDLKGDINDLLVTYLPATVTLAQFEAIAVTINHIILNPEEYLIKK